MFINHPLVKGGFLYANVILGLSVDKLDREFSYKIPDTLIHIDLIGSSVIVPFGSSNKEVKAIVVEIVEDIDFDKTKIKEIIRISDNSTRIEKDIIELAYWLKSNYGGLMTTAIRTVIQIPKKTNEKKRHLISLRISKEEADKLSLNYEKRGYTRLALALRKLMDGELVYENLRGEINLDTFKNLERKQLVKIGEEREYRTPLKLEENKLTNEIILNDEQKYAVDIIKKDLSNELRNAYLLFGVTGSGKTEVYIKIMEEVIKRGEKIIFLIPEISLSFQTVERLSERFGSRIAVINSKISYGEKYDQILMAKNGEVDIVVGPRSALFTPFDKIGLIIIDEEHDTSYKNSNMPRYHSRDVALYIARKKGAIVILGSATPSLEAVNMVEKKELRLLLLGKRANGAVQPSTTVIDLRKELASGNNSILSRKLVELIRDRLEKKEQIILFINRRGYASFVSCRSCGEAIKCPHCDVTLTFHRPNKMVCHYCGYEEVLKLNCPKCNSNKIGTFGIGTERVEEIVKETFKGARVLRLDKDTTRRKNSYEEILKKFKNKEADILIGTQMIVKGHDYENVTLVGILAADLSLFESDFRATETTFQLLLQAAGRAGRGRFKGEVVVQTYKPEHYVIRAMEKNDYNEFYKREKLYRKMAYYPPYIHFLGIVFYSKNEKRVSEIAEYTYNLIKGKEKNIIINIPVWANIIKVNDVYRKIIYLKSENREELVRIKNLVENTLKNDKKYPGCSFQFDFEPYNQY